MYKGGGYEWGEPGSDITSVYAVDVVRGKEDVEFAEVKAG